MTVKRKSNSDPKRKMIAEDLGLSLLMSEYDLDLLAIGIKAPRLTKGQRNVNLLRAVSATHRPMSEKHKQNLRNARHFWKTTEGISARLKISAVLQKWRGMGEVGNK